MNAPTVPPPPDVIHQKLSVKHRRDARNVERGDCWDLIEAAKGGDAQAYGQLYERYVDTVFRFVLYRTADRATAEDLTSETFLRALRRIDSAHYQGRDAGAWFITIARNLILDHIKSSRYQKEVPTGEMLDAGGEWPSSTNMRTVGFSLDLRRKTAVGVAEDLDPADAVANVIYLDTLRSALARARAKLTPAQQEVLRLRFDLGLPVEQTVAAMGPPYNTGSVKALQHRAVRRLGELLPENIR